MTELDAAVPVPAGDGRIRCSACSAPYLPQLTDGRCPVCDAPSPVLPTRSWLPRLSRNEDDRLMAIVIVATVLNVALLALLTVLIARL